MKTFRKVFKSPAYIFISLAIFLIVFILTILYQNINLVREVFANGSAFESLKIIGHLIFSFRSNLNSISIALVFIVSILFAINISFLIYYLLLQKRRVSNTDIGGSGLGLVLGIIGVGCASCGSLLALSLLSLIGAGGLLAYFPLHGQEFGLLGVILLCYSIYSVSKKIEGPLVC